MMNDIKTIVLNRKRELLNLEKGIKKELKCVPAGTLRISKSKGKIQYYHRKDPTDRGGTYISKNNIELAAKLAQKDYDNKLLKMIRKEVEAIDAYLDALPVQGAEEVYKSMNEMRKELIAPVVETDAMFVKRWQAEQYIGKTMDERTPAFLTDMGERVRSKSEVIIANQLAKAGVPYRYEYPVKLKGMGVVYPDFMVLNVRQRKEYYWEHQGMMDDENYAGKAIRKVAAYQKNGIFPGDKLLLTSETKSSPLDVEQVAGVIRHYLT